MLFIMLASGALVSADTSTAQSKKYIDCVNEYALQNLEAESEADELSTAAENSCEDHFRYFTELTREERVNEAFKIAKGSSLSWNDVRNLAVSSANDLIMEARAGSRSMVIRNILKVKLAMREMQDEKAK